MPIVQELEDLDEGYGAIDKTEFIQASLRLYQVSKYTKNSNFFFTFFLF